MCNKCILYVKHLARRSKNKNINMNSCPYRLTITILISHCNMKNFNSFTDMAPISKLKYLKTNQKLFVQTVIFPNFKIS